MVKQQAPAPRPAKPTKKGQFIDFKPRKTAAKAAPRPKPTPKPAPKPTTRPASAQPKIRPAAPKPTPPTSNQPVMRQAATVVETIETIENLDDTFDEIDSIEEEILEETTDFIAEESNLDDYTDALTEAKKAGQIDSPFLTSVNVDKRPLSSRRFVGDDSAAPTSIKEEDFHGSLRNTYTRRRDGRDDRGDHEDRAKRGRAGDQSPTSVVPTPKKSGETTRSIGLIVAIVLTVLLGAAVGAFLYLAFFQ